MKHIIFGLTFSELLFYGGITIMLIAVILIIVSVLFSFLTGRELKRKLEQEYGKPQE